MGINKSGSTNPSMMIRGGNVVTDNGKLVIEGTTGDTVEGVTNCPIHQAMPVYGLQNPPALVHTDLVPLVNHGEVIPANLPIIYTSTVPRLVRDWLFEDGYIIHVYGLGLLGLATATVLNFYWWVQVVTATLIANATVIAADVAIAVLVVVGISYLRSGGGGATTAVVKGCVRGPTPGPVTVPIFRD
jgi:hypothetical protein